MRGGWELGLQAPVSSAPLPSPLAQDLRHYSETPQSESKHLLKPGEVHLGEHEGNTADVSNEGCLNECCPGFLQSTEVEGNDSK